MGRFRRRRRRRLSAVAALAGQSSHRRLIRSAISPGGGAGPVLKMMQNLAALRLNCDEQLRTMAKRVPYVQQEMP